MDTLLRVCARDRTYINGTSTVKQSAEDNDEVKEERKNCVKNLQIFFNVFLSIVKVTGSETTTLADM
jgi:hypothetical protein